MFLGPHLAPYSKNLQFYRTLAASVPKVNSLEKNPVGVGFTTMHHRLNRLKGEVLHSAQNQRLLFNHHRVFPKCWLQAAQNLFCSFVYSLDDKGYGHDTNKKKFECGFCALEFLYHSMPWSIFAYLCYHSVNIFTKVMSYNYWVLYQLIWKSMIRSVSLN